MKELVSYTADNEEPICMNCDNNDISDDFCDSKCGAKHGWGGYERHALVDSEE